MNCINNTCGEKTYANCIIYEGTLPTFSTITDECVSVNDAIADQYTLIGQIKDQTNLSALGETCIDYELDADDNITPATALLQHESEICTLKTQIQTITNGFSGNTNISTWALDMDCLIDACGDSITSLKQLLQALITEVCRLNGTQASGVITQTGNASITVFNIPHGLAFTPTKFNVMPQSAAAAAPHYTTVNSTNIIVTFLSAPPAAANNLVLRWTAN